MENWELALLARASFNRKFEFNHCPEHFVSNILFETGPPLHILTSYSYYWSNITQRAVISTDGLDGFQESKDLCDILRIPSDIKLSTDSHNW